MTKSKLLSTSILTLAIALPAGIAQAQVLEEITVTAQKRAQGLQDVPISIAAVSGQTLEDRSIDSLEDLSTSVPNLVIAETQIDSTISVRGTFTGANKGFEQSVGMYFDGISYGRSQLVRTPLVDLERVEVLRGPQPTLFGKNAIAGAVSVTSAAPTDEFEAKLSASYEFEHEESQLLGVISGPLTENTTGRLVASFRELDGYMTNVTLNRKEPKREEAYLRGKLQWDDGGPIRLNFKGEYATFDRFGIGLENNTPIGNYSALFPIVDVTEDYRREGNIYDSINEMRNAVFRANIDIGDHELTLISGYVGYETDETIDADYTRLDILDNTNQTEEYTQLSQEFRITSPGGEKIDYIAGLYFQTGTVDATDIVRLGSAIAASPAFAPLANSFSDRKFSQSSNLASAFAQGDWNVNDDLTITAGARLSRETKKGNRRLAIKGEPGNVAFTTPNPAAGTPSPLAPLQNQLEFLWSAGLNIAPHEVSGEFTEDTFDPLVRVQYQATDNTNIYASYTEGSKAGGFDIRSNSIPGSPLVPGNRIGTFKFDGERAKNYELGAKMKWDQVQFNVTAFMTDYEDLQTSVFDGILSFVVENAASAEVKGLEADIRYLATENLELYGSAAYLDYQFTDFKQGQCNFDEISNGATGFCDRTGTKTPYTADVTANFGASYNTDISDTLALDVDVNVDYSSDYFTLNNLDPNRIQDSYAKLGAQIGLAGGDGAWRVSLIGKNLTDERIAFTSGGLPLATALTAGAGNAYDSFYARPRNITLKLDYNF